MRTPRPPKITMNADAFERARLDDGFGRHELDPRYSFDAATSRGLPLTQWDDGFGPLWLYRETLGPVGIVRARTFEEAYECVIDEIMYDADPDMDPDTPDGELPEGCHWRGSGVPANAGRHTAIAQEDLNGSSLDPLTPELMREHDITITLTDNESEE